MDNQLFQKARKSLIKHEAYENFPYRDEKNNITIGVGYNLSARGVSNSWIDQNLESDISFFYEKLSDNVWFDVLNEDRQCVLVDMAFNLGLQNFLKFESMIKCLKVKDYSGAAIEMLDSQWAHEVPVRAKELATAMHEGVYNP